MPREFRILPCETLYAFMVYRRKCIKAAMKVIAEDNAWLVDGNHSRHMLWSNKGNPHLYSTWVWLRCTSCDSDGGTGIWAGRKSGGLILYPRRWWSRYRQSVVDQLKLCPSARVPTYPALISKCLDDALSCDCCSQKARVEVEEYSQSLASRIEQAVSEVSK